MVGVVPQFINADGNAFYRVASIGYDPSWISQLRYGIDATAFVDLWSQKAQANAISVEAVASARTNWAVLGATAEVTHIMSLWDNR